MHALMHTLIHTLMHTLMHTLIHTSPPPPACSPPPPSCSPGVPLRFPSGPLRSSGGILSGGILPPRRAHYPPGIAVLCLEAAAGSAARRRLPAQLPLQDPVVIGVPQRQLLMVRRSAVTAPGRPVGRWTECRLGWRVMERGTYGVASSRGCQQAAAEGFSCRRLYFCPAGDGPVIQRTTQ